MKRASEIARVGGAADCVMPRTPGSRACGRPTRRAGSTDHPLRAIFAGVTRRRQAAVLLGLALMTLGAGAPWATAHTLRDGVVSVSGMPHGAALVLGLAALGVLALVCRAHTALALLGLASAAWTVLVMYQLPGSLVAGPAWQAEIAWGAYVALLGALVLSGAGLLLRPDR